MARLDRHCIGRKQITVQPGFACILLIRVNLRKILPFPCSRQSQAASHIGSDQTARNKAEHSRQTQASGLRRIALTPDPTAELASDERDRRAI